MARKIRTAEDIVSEVPVGSVAPSDPNGVVFINNYLNREFTLPNQAKFKFTLSRQLFTDPAQITHLRGLIAESVNSRIFEETPEPVVESPVIEPEPEPAPEPVPDQPPVTE